MKRVLNWSKAPDGASSNHKRAYLEAGADATTPKALSGLDAPQHHVRTLPSPP